MGKLITSLNFINLIELYTNQFASSFIKSYKLRSTCYSLTFARGWEKQAISLSNNSQVLRGKKSISTANQSLSFPLT